MGEQATEMIVLDIAREWCVNHDGTVLNPKAFDEMANGLRTMVGTRLRVKSVGGVASDDGPVIRNVRVEGDPGKRNISLDVEFDELTDPRLQVALMAKANRTLSSGAGFLDKVRSSPVPLFDDIEAVLEDLEGF